MRRTAVPLILLLTPLMWLGAEPAFACSCVQRTVPELVDAADAVAHGRLRERARVSAQEVVYTFAGTGRFKGDMSPRFEVSSPAVSASCGLTGLEVGRHYVVFMTGTEGDFSASSCGGTQLATSRYVDRVEAAARPMLSFDLPRPPATEDGAAASLRRLVGSIAWWD